MKEPDTAVETKDKSVRITLRIRKDCSDAITWLAEYYGITQKELFEQMAKELPSFLVEIRKHRAFKKIEVRTVTARIRKAQLVSSKAYRLLGSLSKRYRTSRDQLIETWVLLTKILLEQQAKESVDKHKEAFKIVEDFWDHAETVKEELRKLLGDEDPILRRFYDVLSVVDFLCQSIEAEIEEGIPINPNRF